MELDLQLDCVHFVRALCNELGLPDDALLLDTDDLLGQKEYLSKGSNYLNAYKTYCRSLKASEWPRGMRLVEDQLEQRRLRLVLDSDSETIWQNFLDEIAVKDLAARKEMIPLLRSIDSWVKNRALVRKTVLVKTTEDAYVQDIRNCFQSSSKYEGVYSGLTDVQALYEEHITDEIMKSIKLEDWASQINTWSSTLERQSQALLTCIKAWLSNREIEAAKPKPEYMLRIDQNRGYIFINEHKIELPPKDLSILMLLAKNPEEPLHKDCIHKKVWNSNKSIPSQVEDTIKTLRKFIGPALHSIEPTDFIKNVRTGKYALMLPSNCIELLDKGHDG